LGGSATITAVNPNALTIGTGLSGTSYNGSSVVTIANTGVTSINGSTGAISYSGSSSSGYQTLPGGSIIQWGSLSVGANSTGTGTLPLTYPNSFASIVGAHGNGGAWNNYNVYVTGPGGIFPISNSQFYLANLDDSTITFYWIAMGY
jgi:hypothetical protein